MNKKINWGNIPNAVSVELDRLEAKEGRRAVYSDHNEVVDSMIAKYAEDGAVVTLEDEALIREFVVNEILTRINNDYEKAILQALQQKGVVSSDIQAECWSEEFNDDISLDCAFTFEYRDRTYSGTEEYLNESNCFLFIVDDREVIYNTLLALLAKTSNKELTANEIIKDEIRLADSLGCRDDKGGYMTIEIEGVRYRVYEIWY